ncbi:MAG: glutathione S-transferase [Burkholderiales bacterium]
MLKLCGFAISNYYNKVKVALLEKGIPFEEEYCMVSQEPALLARSPMGKVPFLDLGGGRTLSESQAILEYLEDVYPQNPLYPKDAFARARCRELIAHIELHLELVARRLYPEAFFGGKVSDETRQRVEKDIAKGVRTLKALAKFSPWIAGAEFTAADCAAAVHLPLVGLATKIIYGKDALAGFEQVKAYQKMAFERPSIRKVNEDRKAAVEARQKK